MNICIDCGVEYNKSGINQKRCGSIKLRSGCSYDRHRFLKRNSKDGLPRRNKRQTPVKIILLNERGWICEKCGIKNDKCGFFDIDHIIPRRKIGLNRSALCSRKDFNNLMIMCPNCHRIKTLQEGWR